MLKHLYIEKTIETFDSMIEEMQDRDDRDDFAAVVSHLAELRDEMVTLEEEDG